MPAIPGRRNAAGQGGQRWAIPGAWERCIPGGKGAGECRQRCRLPGRGTPLSLAAKGPVRMPAKDAGDPRGAGNAIPGGKGAGENAGKMPAIPGSGNAAGGKGPVKSRKDAIPGRWNYPGGKGRERCRRSQGSRERRHPWRQRGRRRECRQMLAIPGAPGTPPSLAAKGPRECRQRCRRSQGAASCTAARGRSLAAVIYFALLRPAKWQAARLR